MAPSILTNLGCAGGAAVITVTFIHPIDTVKTRLQVSGTGNARNYAELGLAGTCSTIAKEEGIAAFWKGIPAAWMREASYTSFRLGLYAPLKKAFGADKPDSPFIMKFAAGGASGGTRPGVAIAGQTGDASGAQPRAVLRVQRLAAASIVVVVLQQNAD